MAMCHELPHLPLDRDIPLNVLKRRGAISFSSSSVLFSSRPRLERRGAISYEKTDKTAIYVRTLGDVRVHSADLARSQKGKKKQPPAKAAATRAGGKENLEREETPIRRMPARLSRCSSCCQGTVRKKRPQPSLNEHGETFRGHGQVDQTYPGQAKTLLDRLGRWDFNIFHLEEITGGHSLQAVGMRLFEENGLISEFQLDPGKLWKCFTLFESGYHGHPYHNSTHAADVTQAMHCYLQESKLKNTLSPLEVLAALLAAAAHDLDHPGVNQAYLIATNHHLSTLYKNSSVLENHHWRCCISVVIQTGLLNHIPADQWRTFKDLIQSMILATDIARQQEFLSKFQDQLNSGKLNLQNQENRKLVLQMALKCADICNPCRSWNIARKWAECVCQEFFKQGDREKKEGLPVSASCNKYKITTAKIQQGFLKYVVEPLFKLWNEFLPSELSEQMLSKIDKHQLRWTKIVNGEENKREASPAPSTEIMVIDRISQRETTVDLALRSKVEKRKMEESSSSAIRIVDKGSGRVIRTKLPSPKGEQHLVKCNNHKDAMVKKQDGLIMDREDSIDRLQLPAKSQLPNHHSPSSPRPKRKELLNKDRNDRFGAEQFQLRLKRSPATVRRGLKFEDPWEKQPTSLRDSQLYLSHNVLNSVSKYTADQLSRQNVGPDVKRTRSPIVPRRGGLKAGLNNNIESYIPRMGNDFDVGLNQNMSHSTTEVPSAASSSASYSCRPASSYAPSHLHPQFNSLQSLPIHRQLNQSLDQCSDGSPGSSLLGSGDLSISGTYSRDEVNKRTTIRGSPYIQRRMARRETPRQNYQPSAFLAGGLSPRLPSKNYTPSSSPTSPPSSHLYSVPPALSPLMNDFTTSQMASIAKRKQQRERSQSPRGFLEDR